MTPPHSVNIHEAKTQLSRLLARVEAGEEITINRAGKPVARLVPIAKPTRTFGLLAGAIRIAPNFDDPMPDLEAEFEDTPVHPDLGREG